MFVWCLWFICKLCWASGAPWRLHGNLVNKERPPYSEGSKFSISSHFSQILTHFEFISSPNHTFQRRRTSSVLFESLIYVPHGLKSLLGCQTRFLGKLRQFDPQSKNSSIFSTPQKQNCFCIVERIFSLRWTSGLQSIIGRSALCNFLVRSKIL